MTNRASLYMAVCLGLSLCFDPSGEALAQNFAIEKDVLDAAGAVAASANFRVVTAVGQPTPIGLSQSGSFKISAGFLAGTAGLCRSNGDVNNNKVLTAEDARCAFRIFLYEQSVPSDCDIANWDCEVIAANVNCDALVTPGDALAIFQRFLASGSPTICFAQQQLAATAENVNGISAQQHFRVEPSRIQAGRSGHVSIPIVMDAYPGRVAFGFVLEFDPETAEFVELRATDASSGWQGLEAVLVEPGRLVVGAFDAAGLPDDAVNAALRRDGSVNVGHVVFQEKAQSIEIHAVDWKEQILGGSASQPEAGFVSHLSFGRPYPNPSFGGGTLVTLAIPSGTRLSVEVNAYDVQGRLVKKVFDGELPSGIQWIRWDQDDSRGNRVHSGIYFLRLKAQDKFIQRKLVVLK